MVVLVACLSATVGTGRSSLFHLPTCSCKLFRNLEETLTPLWKVVEMMLWIPEFSVEFKHLHRENGCISIISCGYKPTNHCFAVGKSHFYLGFYICEKGMVTLFRVTLPSMPGHCPVAHCCRVAATIQKLMDPPSREDGSAQRYPLSKTQIPKPTVCTVFQREWGGRSSSQACP